MLIKLPYNYTLKMFLSQEQTRVGICSKHNDYNDKHCLLMDFDKVMDDSLLYDSLSKIQDKYLLPEIHIISSSSTNYHAYCFCSRPFREIIHILSDIPEIDMAYLRLGMVRGYYTLRITPRKNDGFYLAYTLPSEIPNELEPYDLTVSSYLTSNNGGKNNA